MNQSHAKLEAIFEAALEVPAEQRQTFLEKACGSDQALLHQVELLLRNLSRAGNFLSDEKGSALEEANALLKKPGSIIGRFKLLEKIGNGGCGVVCWRESFTDSASLNDRVKD